MTTYSQAPVTVKPSRWSLEKSRVAIRADGCNGEPSKEGEDEQTMDNAMSNVRQCIASIGQRREKELGPYVPNAGSSLTTVVSPWAHAKGLPMPGDGLVWPTWGLGEGGHAFESGSHSPSSPGRYAHFDPSSAHRRDFKPGDFESTRDKYVLRAAILP